MESSMDCTEVYLSSVRRFLSMWRRHNVKFVIDHEEEPEAPLPRDCAENPDTGECLRAVRVITETDHNRDGQKQLRLYDLRSSNGFESSLKQTLKLKEDLMKSFPRLGIRSLIRKGDLIVRQSGQTSSKTTNFGKWYLTDARAYRQDTQFIHLDLGYTNQDNVAIIAEELSTFSNCRCIHYLLYHNGEKLCWYKVPERSVNYEHRKLTDSDIRSLFDGF